jgi:hypothetical protein
MMLAVLAMLMCGGPLAVGDGGEATSCPASGCDSKADGGGGGTADAYAKTPVPLRSLGIPLGHVEIRDTLPTASEVANKYLNPSGTPVLLRGAAQHLLADTKVEDWTDEYLARYPIHPPAASATLSLPLPIRRSQHFSFSYLPTASAHSSLPPSIR